MTDIDRVNEILEYSIANKDYDLCVECLNSCIEFDFKYLCKIVRVWLNTDLEICKKALDKVNRSRLSEILNDYRTPKESSKAGSHFRHKIRKTFYQIVTRFSVKEFVLYHHKLNHNVSFEAIAYAIIASNNQVLQKYLDSPKRSSRLVKPKTTQKTCHLLYIILECKQLKYFQKFCSELSK